MHSVARSVPLTFISHTLTLSQVDVEVVDVLVDSEDGLRVQVKLLNSVSQEKLLYRMQPTRWVWPTGVAVGVWAVQQLYCHTHCTECTYVLNINFGCLVHSSL